MNAANIIAGLGDPAPYFLCKNLNDRASTARYRVPLENRPIAAYHLDAPHPKAAALALSELPDLPSTRQLRVLLESNLGLGIWAPKLVIRASDSAEDGLGTQEALGSLILFPPNEWNLAREEFAEWQFDGIDVAFEDLPYSFDDILPFSGPNFSPDRWLLILRGSMAGNVCWWTHDGESEMHQPWALDIKMWGERVFAEAPDVLGGIIRFSAVHSSDAPPENAELYPVEYHSDGGAD